MNQALTPTVVHLISSSGFYGSERVKSYFQDKPVKYVA